MLTLQNSKQSLIESFENLHSLVWDSAINIARYSFENLDDNASTFSEAARLFDNSFMNKIYGNFFTGFALSPIEESDFSDMIQLIFYHRSIVGGHDFKSSVAKSYSNRYWSIVMSMRMDLNLPTKVGSAIDFATKVTTAFKLGTPIGLPKSLSDSLGYTAYDFFFNKTQFSYNFKNEDVFSQETSIPFGMACLSIENGVTMFDSNKDMIEKFMEYM